MHLSPLGLGVSGPTITTSTSNGGFNAVLEPRLEILEFVVGSYLCTELMVCRVNDTKFHTLVSTLSLSTHQPNLVEAESEAEANLEEGLVRVVLQKAHTRQLQRDLQNH